jgi:hypothetical protein
MMLVTTRSLVRKFAITLTGSGSSSCIGCSQLPSGGVTAVVSRISRPSSSSFYPRQPFSRGFSTAPTSDGGSDADDEDDVDGEANKEAATATGTTIPPKDDATPNTTVKAVNDELKKNLKPSEIVDSLNRHIVGQHDAKRAVAIAMRNRWRRRQLPDELRKEVTPRNVLLVGPTGYVCVLVKLFLSLI